MPDGLYETDALAWSERQADLLRRHAEGKLLNEAVDWRGEVLAFLGAARRHFAPSMRQRVDILDLYAGALRQARVATDRSGLPRPLPEICPIGLDELFARNVDFDLLDASLALSA